MQKANVSEHTMLKKRHIREDIWYERYTLPSPSCDQKNLFSPEIVSK